MAIYYPGCDTDELPDYQCDDCGNREKARVRSTGYVTDAYYATLIANPTSLPVWQTGINSGDIVIIPKVTGTLEPSDPITGPGYGDDIEEVLGTDFTLTTRDPNYGDNCTFYNTLKRKKGVYHAIYRTENKTHISDKTVIINTRAPITENLEDNVEWNVTARWRSEDNPCPFDTPEGVFECFQVV